MDNILSTFPYFTTPVQNEAFQDLVGTHLVVNTVIFVFFLNDIPLSIINKQMKKIIMIC